MREKDRVQKDIEKSIQLLQQRIKDVRKAKRLFDKGLFQYSVYFHSLWTHEGAKHVSEIGKIGESKKDVIKKAKEKFKEVNGTVTDQALMIVYLYVIDNNKVLYQFTIKDEMEKFYCKN